MAPFGIFGKKESSAKDPVCGMSVDITRAEWTSTVNGANFCFCSKGCKEAFDANPSSYTSGGQTVSHGGHHA